MSGQVKPTTIKERIETRKEQNRNNGCAKGDPTEKYLDNLLALEVVEEIANGKKGKTPRQVSQAHDRAHYPYTQTFSELLEKILPDEALLLRHKELLDDHRVLREITINTTDPKAIRKATRGMKNFSTTVNKEQGYTTIIVNEPDRQARKEALEMAYKIKGHFAPQKLEIKRDYEELDDEEITALLQSIGDDDSNPLK